MSYHHKSGAQKRREKAMRAEGQNALKQHGFAGVETRDTQCGGGWGCVCPLQVRYEKRGGGGGCCPL